jgi:hypothetical protein
VSLPAARLVLQQGKGEGGRSSRVMPITFSVTEVAQAVLQHAVHGSEGCHFVNIKLCQCKLMMHRVTSHHQNEPVQYAPATTTVMTRTHLAVAVPSCGHMSRSLHRADSPLQGRQQQQRYMCGTVTVTAHFNYRDRPAVAGMR